MHIFVADEHPPAVFRYTRRRALRILRRSAGFRRHSVWAWRKGKRVSARKWLPFYPSSKAPASRGQLTNRAATISDGGAAFHGFGCRFDGGRQVTSLTLRENAYAITYRRFDKRPSRGFVVFRSADQTQP